MKCKNCRLTEEELNGFVDRRCFHNPPSFEHSWEKVARPKKQALAMAKNVKKRG